MPGEYDEQFELITGLLQKTAGGLDELRMEVRDMRSELRKNTDGLARLDQKVTVLSSQFADVGIMAIEDHDKVEDLERRVTILETEVR